MHEPGANSPSCVSCHMHKTTFARMDRSDHSMLPPSPAATIAFGSPNACNSCHAGKDAAWADTVVRKWRKRDYQAPVIHRGKLVAAARKGDWGRLDDMLTYVLDKGSDPVFVTSLVRLLRNCPDSAKWPVLLETLNHSDPLARSAAAEALGPPPSDAAVQALVLAAGDSFRLVRIKAAASLNGIPVHPTKREHKENLDRANKEYRASLTARPDLWTSHYNLGNYYLHRHEYTKASAAYETAHRLAPQAVPPLVNGAMARVAINDKEGALERLGKSASLDPDNPIILFNMGLLEAEQGNNGQALKHLKAALAADPEHARAAYNLSVLLASANPEDSVDYAQQAFEIQQDPAYGFNYAYAQYRAGNRAETRDVLRSLIRQWPEYGDAYALLYEVAETDIQKEEVRRLIIQGSESSALSPQDQLRLGRILR